MDENKLTREIVQENFNRYFLEIGNEEPVRVYGVVKVEDFDRNTVFQMFKDDNEFRFTIDKEVVNLLPGETTRITNIIGHLDVNGEERVYLSEFSYRIEDPEYGPGKNITFSYEEAWSKE